MFPVTTDVYLTENHYEPLSLNLIPISKISCPGSMPILSELENYVTYDHETYTGDRTVHS